MKQQSPIETAKSNIIIDETADEDSCYLDVSICKYF